MIGHHDLGELYFVAHLSDAPTWFGMLEEETFETHTAFSALITVVHETYHLMQDVFLGACSLAASADDSIVDLLGTPQSSPNSPVRRKEFEARFLYRRLVRRALTTNVVSGTILKRQIAATPQFAERFSPFVEMTPRELIECHAAIHTELYISSLLEKRKDAFRESIVRDLRGLFRVSEMDETYRRPLNVMKSWIPFCDFTLANTQHPLYPYCEHAAEYTLLAFLLDHALHLPPLDEPMAVTTLGVVAADEDATPVCRFAKLLGTLGAEMMFASKTGRDFVLRPDVLYTDVLPRLLWRANLSNILSIAQNKGARTLPRISDLVDLDRDSVLQILGLRDVFDTFLAPEYIAELWLRKLARLEGSWPYPRTLEVRVRAMKLRLKMASLFFTLGPMSFFSRVRLPGFFLEHKGRGKMFPPVVTYENGNYVPVGLSFEIIDEIVPRALTVAVAEGVVGDQVIQCPLTRQGLQVVSCPSRSKECEKLRSLKAAPKEGCRLRETLDKLKPTISAIGKRKRWWPF